MMGTHARTTGGAAFAVLLVCACATGGTFFVPDQRTSADRARELDAKCRGVSAAAALPLLSRDVVDSVEPSYAYVLGGPNGREARLRGARIHVRPLAGQTRESIARALECHEARVVLGAEQAPADDPYVLADRWLAIDVDSERDGFAVAVQTDDLDGARRVLERARAFAGARTHE